MSAYYNEIDPFAAQWLRELIKAGLIAPGDVDGRSIEDVTPNDLRGYSQCHFFAGIGGWSYALRLAGWPDDRPVWTGSCPCQPFSAAGKGKGFADERHLWPSWYWLVQQCRPAIVFGEQVASKATNVWFDLVQTDMETMGYAFGCVPFPAASLGAPHIRDRAYWVANSAVLGRQCEPHQGTPGIQQTVFGAREQRVKPCTHGASSCVVADTRSVESRLGHRGSSSHGWMGNSESDRWDTRWAESGRLECAPTAGEFSGLANAAGGDGTRKLPDQDRKPQAGREGVQVGGCLHPGRPSSTNGFWRDADWLFCRDGKWRPVSASPQPLVDGSAESLGRVCDACVREVEEEINATAMEAGVDTDAAMRDLWKNLITEARQKWSAGRLPGLHEAPFLLSFLRQLAEQGWRFKECIPISREETSQEALRVLWSGHGASCPSHRYELAQQPSGKYSNALRVLSSVLARHAHKAWGYAHKAYAESGFPLVHDTHNRVGRLRGYGNAIVPWQAAEFIKAVMEAKS